MKATTIVWAVILIIGAGSTVAQTIPDPTDTILLTSAPPYNATGELFISKADTNSVGLHCPILLAEGFDLNNTMGWEVLYSLLDQENLIGEIHAFGRDILILNFTDSTDDILANAALTESAISYINSNRADSTDKFTAVGVSLGGLTVRKALVDMPNHDVDTWISLDAPHEGANIPLGLQEYIEFYAPYSDEAEAYLITLDRPAPQQLLLVHHSHADGLAGGSPTHRDSFVAAMDAAGYPTNCKTIAISNGSGFGEKHPFNPGDLIIHWENSLFITIDSDIHALPQTLSTVFYGNFDFFGNGDEKTVTSYYPLSLDNAPGGTRSTFFELYSSLDYIDGNDSCVYSNHCFIPTVSALGIPIENIESNLSAHAELTALSPFDEIHYAPTNEPHVEINMHNKRWLMRAVLEGYDTDRDGLDDYQEFLVGTAYNSAGSKLTVGAVMEVQLINSKAVLSWELFPNTQYEVWFSEALVGPWSSLETIPPSTDPDITREYALDTAVASGFFKIVAAPVDPVTD
ncbi:MAG: hypothetical protein K9M45_11940 [Kiritimatiellales bacterium]|nr:hypothetical protein [Kiritimatiellales bacterium]